MKKFFVTLFIGLFICNTSLGKSKSMGKGLLNLSEGTISHFLTYIKSKSEGTPHIFLLGHVSDKEQYSHYWFCPGTTDNCRFANIGQFISTCEKAAKKRHNKDIKCYIFAKKRKIVWNNGINPGKGKKSIVRKKWTRQEYIAKFTELGFFGDDTSLNTTSSSISTDINDQNNQIIFNKCKLYEGESEFYNTFSINLKKNKIYQEFYAEGEIFPITLSIIKNDNSQVVSKIKSWGTKKNQYHQYTFDKKTNDAYEILYKDKKGKILEQETKLFCENVSGYWNNNENKLKKKNVKKYELKGERSIALSWDGYSDLIAGTVEFDETDYKGAINILLPNNDGNCEGSYSLQENGKGTWQISCTNNMGAAGTLKWIRNGGVTGSGRDHNDKKVKFTVSKKG
jgi:hypothetical protein